MQGCHARASNRLRPHVHVLVIYCGIGLPCKARFASPLLANEVGCKVLSVRPSIHLQEDTRKLERALEEATGDVDILLTCEWPADVTAATPPGSAPVEACVPGKSP